MTCVTSALTGRGPSQLRYRLLLVLRQLARYDELSVDDTTADINHILAAQHAVATFQLLKKRDKVQPWVQKKHTSTLRFKASKRL